MASIEGLITFIIVSSILLAITIIIVKIVKAVIKKHNQNVEKARKDEITEGEIAQNNRKAGTEEFKQDFKTIYAKYISYPELLTDDEKSLLKDLGIIKK